MIELNEQLISQYQLIRKEEIEELKTIGYLLKHKKTGANVVVMSNDDDNKVFDIGFKTPPMDDTGLPHILEHSVLCGSKKFPIKDPFVELVKGSLNTFINAMTYPDKTVYPVASCNEKDFNNLMDVYLDAVFNPNIYRKREIFMQEGWHYELEDIDSDLEYNGVVYNEMKGAYSTPDSVLNRNLLKELFPDNCYSSVSGGDPKKITRLSYGQFLDFHKKYYHPSNSYISIYGNADMNERLVWLDKEYLSHFDRLDIDSSIKEQKPFESVKLVEKTYPIGKEESTENKTFLSYAVVTNHALDRKKYYAMKVLSYALIIMPGAPLKKALTDAGIGTEIKGGNDEGCLQSYFTIIAKNTEKNRLDEFVKIIEDTLKDILMNGIDKDSLKAALNVIEFEYREADYGNYPKGLLYCLNSLDSWLYDENEPFMHIKAGKTFEELNEMVDTGYFEDIVREYFLDNNHKVIFTLIPQAGQTEAENAELEKELRSLKNSFTKEELEKIVEETKALKEYQSAPSTQEELATIPLLELKDIDELPKNYAIKEINVDGIKVIHSDVFSNGIAYIKASFNTISVPEELLPYVGIVSKLFGLMDTKNYNYIDLNNVINMHSGGFSSFTMLYNISDENFSNEKNGYDFRLEAEIKVFYKEMQFAFEILKEILLGTKVEDEKRLLEIITEQKSKLKLKLLSSGHMTALNRANSYINEAGMLVEMMGGIEAYNFYEKLEKDFESNKQEIISNIKKVIELIFNKNNLIIGCTADKEGYDLMEKKLSILTNELNEDKKEIPNRKLEIKVKNEGFKTSAPVSYVARVGNFRKAGYEFSGVMETLNNILDYDYLWTNVRVKGGAYGVYSLYNKNSGNVGFVSYRDPNVGKTNDIYETVPDYLRNLEADDRDVLKFIIGTISKLDTPLTPAAQGQRSFAAYMCHQTYEKLLEQRKTVLSLNVEKIREVGNIIEDSLKEKLICVVGNAEKIEKDKELFNEIKTLFA